MHTVFALLCFVVVIHWLIFSYPSGLLHWHCGNLTIAPVPAKQPWWIWINTSCEFIMNDCITSTKQSTTKPCAYFLGYTVWCCIFKYIYRSIRKASCFMIMNITSESIQVELTGFRSWYYEGMPSAWQSLVYEIQAYILAKLSLKPGCFVHYMLSDVM